MTESQKKDTIIICMGSSCFARGNMENLRIIEKFIFKRKLQDKIILKGTLCEDECTRGPVITINGRKFFGVSPDEVEDLVADELGYRGEN